MSRCAENPYLSAKYFARRANNIFKRAKKNAPGVDMTPEARVGLLYLIVYLSLTAPQRGDVLAL